MNKKHFILIGLCLLQLILLYGTKSISDKTIIGLFLCIIQLGIGISSVFFTKPAENYSIKKQSTIPTLYWMSFVFAAILLALNILKNTVAHVAIEQSGSDVIPQIQIMCEHFIKREFPYQIIHFDGYDMNPTYMPMQWLSYVPAMLMHIDIRIMASIFFSASALFVCYWFIQKSKLSFHPVWIGTLLLCLLVIPYAIQYHRIVFPTVEQGVAAFYLIIPCLIAMKKYHWASFMICICLLSRYSILLWVPLYLLVLYIHQPKLAIQQFIIITVGVVAIYVVPFMTTDPEIFMNGYRYHTGAAIGEWEHLNEQNVPYHLFDGQGLANLFYSLKQYSIETRLHLLQKIHLLISGGFILIALISYSKFRKKISMEHFMISTLMIYITLFYSFIQIPYKYLFIVPAVILIGGVMSIFMLTPEYQAHKK